MKFTYLIFMTILLFTLSFQGCKSEEKIKAIDQANMDLTESPVHDFDNYANGGWKINNLLPADKSRYGSFDKLRDIAESQLQKLFDKVIAETHKLGTIGQKITDFHAVGMDSVTIEEQGAKPLMPYLAQIEAVQTISDIQLLITEFHYAGSGILFSFFGSADRQKSDWVIAQLYQGGLGMNDRDYYLKQDDRTIKIRNEYFAHLAKMFLLAGNDVETAKSKAELVLALETRLANASLTRLECRDPHRTYNKMNLATLTELSPDFNWDNFFSTLGFPEQEDINVGMPITARR